MKKLIKVALLALSVTALFSCGNGGKKSENPKGSTWTVEFMLNNGTEDVYKTISVENNKTITESIGDPTRDGYTFDGWYVDQACTVYFDEVGDKVTADMKVYAKWAASGISNPNTPGQGDSGTSEDPGTNDTFELPAGAVEEAPTSGYALMVTTADDHVYYYPLTPVDQFEGFDQQMADNAIFNAGDKIQLYDGTNSAAWVEDNLNSFSIAGFTANATDGIVCETSGTYDVYAKFKYQEDEVYIGPAEPAAE